MNQQDNSAEVASMRKLRNWPQSLGICIGVCVSVAAAILSVRAADVSYGDLTDVFCGHPLQISRPSEPVVVPPHVSPITVPVSIAGFAFNPSDLTINVGDTVTWTNNDGVIHTTTSDSLVWNSGSL